MDLTKIITNKENSITVTIPYDRLGSEVYEQDKLQDGSLIFSTNTHDDGKNTPVDTHDDWENTPVNSDITPDGTPVNRKNTPVNSGITSDDTPGNNEKNLADNSDLSIEDKILIFCSSPKGILEIAVHLGFKEKKTVRKYLKPLVDLGRIAMTVPDKPNSNNQKYITIK